MALMILMILSCEHNRALAPVIDDAQGGEGSVLGAFLCVCE